MTRKTARRGSSRLSGSHAGVAAIAGPLIVVLIVALFPVAAVAQGDRKPRTRAEVIEQERREKRALLWPDRQSPIAEMVNGFVERGLLDGVQAGLGGGNGMQITVGGMRSGQGISFGVGYRRSDLWNDRVDFRATVRGTPAFAWMLDGQFYFPALYTERGFLDVYTRYEYSPQMDYYGDGPDSEKEDRSSYRLEDWRLQARGGWEFYDFLRIGGTAGAIVVSTGSGKRSGVPSIEEEFDPADIPGLFVFGDFIEAGVFVQLDWRDNPNGARSGGNYKAEWTRYWDITEEDQFNFRRVDLTVDQYFPYFNKTRVIAIHLDGAYTFTDDGQEVPFYLQPTLGGNDNLRGFNRYRFYANNAFYVNVEHRWHSFAGLDMAVFVDVGKVSEFARLLYQEDLAVSGGIGFRFKLKDAVIMRIDQAYGNEGYGFIWTFSDIF